jgi:signal recognition particle subunit SRP54
MFDAITSSLSGAMSFLDMSGKLTEANTRAGLKAVRQALLESDVNYDVAQKFAQRVAREVVGRKILDSATPQEMVYGIIYQEMVNLLGPVDHELKLRRDGLSIIMLCGLQGSGKTTTCGKLAKKLKAEGKTPMLVAADLQRPAAIEQLKTIGAQLDVPVYSEAPSSNPVTVCENGVKQAKAQNCDVVILDTAGRLHIDSQLMDELREIDRRVEPQQILFVCDAMTGQDAVNSAKAFNDALELDGIVMTKLDGDARGGAMLSVKQVTGVPIKFMGIGEQFDKLELFHPERMAQRILGGGDMATLGEIMAQKIDQDTMKQAQDEMLSGKFTFDSFLAAMQQIKKMGSIKSLLSYIPGMSGMMGQLPDLSNADEDMKRIEGIIKSMTADERRQPELIDLSRRRRIARGSGVEAADVHKLLKDFDGMSKMMQGMGGLNLF